MRQVESITDVLKRRLLEAGAARFEAIAARAGVKTSFIRKFVYGSRPNPRVLTIQPLLDYFAAVDRGEEQLPEVEHRAASVQRHATEKETPAAPPGGAPVAAIASAVGG